MSKTYQPLEMEIICFQSDDVITTSNCPWEGELATETEMD